MHTLVIMSQSSYRENMENLVYLSAKKYEKACYISFNDPYHIVVNMLENVNVEKDKFIVVDISGVAKERQTVNKTTYVLPSSDLFNLYLFMRGLINEEGIKVLLIDSISSLIYKYNELNLKGMLTNLLLEAGTQRCDSSIVVFDEHKQHEVVNHLSPFIGKSVVLY